MFESIKRKLSPPVSVETQLAILRECGIAAATPAIEEAVLRRVKREAASKRPYLSLLCVLGDEAEHADTAGSDGFPSDNIWHFDTECIEDHGDYARIVERLAALSRGILAISDVSDFVDIESGTAWLSFRWRAEEYRWVAAVSDDWVDDGILSKFGALLAASGTDLRYTHIDLGGQDCLIGCASPQEKDALARRTGLKASWLNDE